MCYLVAQDQFLFSWAYTTHIDVPNFSAPPSGTVSACSGARRAIASAHPGIIGADGTGELVVYTGHLYPWKGAHVLARASASLRARRPGARIAIVGRAFLRPVAAPTTERVAVS